MTEQNTEVKTNQSKTLEIMVKNAITVCNEEVFNKVKEHLVNQEIQKRTDLLIKGLEKLNELRGALKKVNNPDSKLFDGDGKEVVAAFTKEKLEEIKKAKEALEKHEKNLEKAFGGDFSGLKG